MQTESINLLTTSHSLSASILKKNKINKFRKNTLLKKKIERVAINRTSMHRLSNAADWERGELSRPFAPSFHEKSPSGQ